MPLINPKPDMPPIPVEFLDVKLPTKTPSLIRTSVVMPDLSDWDGRHLNLPLEYKTLEGKYFVWPVLGRVTSGFGKRWGRIHEGIDIPMPTGTPIQAVRAGTVIRTDAKMRGYGRIIIIDHGNGINTYYAHCSAFATKVGDKVSAGQVIGYVGNSGKSSASHLHFEVRIRNVAYNPLRFLQGYPSLTARNK